MRSALPWIAVALLAACQPSAEAALSRDDRAAIRTATDRYVQAVLAADWDTWAELSADNAVFLPPGGGIVQGQDAIRQWGTALSGMNFFTSVVLEVEGRGDRAVSHGLYDYALRLGPAMQVGDSGTFLTVWRQETDGEWRITHNMWTSTRPTTAPAPRPP